MRAGILAVDRDPETGQVTGCKMSDNGSGMAIPNGDRRKSEPTLEEAEWLNRKLDQMFSRPQTK